MRIIDISVLANDKITIWPGNTSPQIRRLSDMKKGDAYNETSLEMNVHTGTHIDAPLHFISKGVSIDKSPLDIFIGPAFVAYLPKVKEITVKDLGKLSLPKGIKRILFKTSNSLLWEKKVKKFKKDYVGLTADAASWLVKRGIKLVGMDYLSIAKFGEAVAVHKILLGNNVYIIESLNLTGVKPSTYELICLPLKIADSEAAPVRAVLLTE
jgi:arylformamidase